MGKPKRYAQALIFKNKYFIEDFITPDDVTFLYGADWGFAEDPTCLIRAFVKDKDLYIDHEFYGHGVEITELAAGFDTVPGARMWQIHADCSRPDTISFMKNQGFIIDGAEKGKDSVEDGIQFLRSFKRIVINPRCKGSISDFSNYRWKEDTITGDILPIPVDKANHACFVAGTKILMGDMTEKNIESVIAGEFVMTPEGSQEVLKSALSQENAVVKDYYFSDGSHLRCTPDHPIYTEKEKIAIDALRYCDKIRTWKTSNSRDKDIAGTEDIGRQLEETHKGERISIVRFGNLLMERFQRAFTSIIKIKMQIIIQLRISPLFQRVTIAPTIAESTGKIQSFRSDNSSIWKKFESRQKNGTLPQRGMNGIRKTELMDGRIRSHSITPAEDVGKHIEQGIGIRTDFVQTHVKAHGEGIRNWIGLIANALYAKPHLGRVNTPTQRPVRLVAVESSIGRTAVYNLTVNKTHSYYANGILVSNCDAARYALFKYIKSECSIYDIL
jgi:hypothetical protein